MKNIKTFMGLSAAFIWAARNADAEFVTQVDCIIGVAADVVVRVFPIYINGSRYWRHEII